MFKTSCQDRHQPSGFLRLPLELRNNIYSFLLVRGAIHVQYLQFEVRSWTRSMWENTEQLYSFEDIEAMLLKSKTGILRVSRQISEEALNLLYGCNLFIILINGGAHDNLLETLKIDDRLWVPLLTDLTRLCLVAQQPLRAVGYYNAPSLEEDMREWVAWLEPILRYLARIIPKPSIVEVDHNHLTETGELVEKCFPSGYEIIQTVTGDKKFMRDEFLCESGYWEDDSGMNFADGGMGDDWSD